MARLPWTVRDSWQECPQCYGRVEDTVITTPAGVVAKYCNKYVCVCVFLSASIFLCILPIAVARSASDGVTQSQGEGAILGVFFPIDDALYSIAFRTHTKTAELIEMPSSLIYLFIYLFIYFRPQWVHTHTEQ